MCGIAGVYSLTGRPPDPAWGPLLVAALRHRGPDGDGVYADQRVVLAHTRLAIIDRGPGGHQPMRSADDRQVIVQNGEVYNYTELRAELERNGAGFRTASDTEVLVELLAREDVGGLARVRGMFAFARYDRETGDLLLARDRLGKKPVVWVRTPEYFAWASEVRALLSLPFVPKRLDRAALPHYVELLYVPSPFTLIEGVRKLEPASYLRLAGDERRTLSGGRYWRPPPPDPGQRADRAWFAAFDREFLESTRLRTVSDVPIGVFLSGGVDSNAVLECLHRVGHRPIRTFTVGFHGLPDERPIAREAARTHSDHHTELVLEPDLASEIPPILRHFGEPLGDSAVITNALIARAAAAHVKVVLNGDGGDELFGGYLRYPFSRRADLLSRVPGATAMLAGGLSRRPRLAAVFEALAHRRPDLAARALASVMTPHEREALLAPGHDEHHPLAPARDVDGGLLGAIFAWDREVYLPDDLLVKVDVASMAFGLENRSPFLDYRLFELVSRLPPARRAALFATKPLLRRLVHGRIPSAALAAPKRGFSLPLEHWLRGPLRGWLDGLLADPQAIAPCLRQGATRRMLSRFHDGADDGMAPLRLWSLAALEFWAREFSVETGP